MSQTVTNYTSVVLVPTGTINSYIVYLPSLTGIGHIITIRDNDGNASPSNKIQISTTTGVTFADGSSSVSITNPYGYVTVRVNSQTVYNVINTYRVSPVVTNVDSLNLSNVEYIDQVTNLPVITSVSSSLFYVNGERVGDITNTQLQSTVANLGSLGYISTIPQIIPVSTMFVTGSTLRTNIQYTTDGSTWSEVNPVFGQHIFNQGNAILYANDMFVAVGEDNSPRANIQWSLDGENWNYSTSPATTDIKRQVSFGNGIWHVVGETSVYSTDGRIWNTFSNPLTNSYGITYGRGVWVAGGEGVTPLAWSRDGVNWANAVSPSTLTTVYTSSTSILCPPWPFASPPAPAPPSSCDPCKKKEPPKPPKVTVQSTIVNNFTSSVAMVHDVGYDGTQFIAVVSTTNTNVPNILYSTDGSNWLSSNVVGTSPNWRYIYGNGQMWIATGCNIMSYSVNGGSNWTVTPYFVGSNFSFTRPYWNGTQWWVGQISGSIWSSSNGLTWSQNQNFTGTAFGFTYIPPITGGAYVIPSTVAGLGSAGYISTSQFESTFANIFLAPLVQEVSTIYSYTGFNQTFIVPGNISSLEFSMWGAGGGGASGGTDITLTGGGAAFLSGTLVVDPYDTITVIVGQGGLPGYLGGNTTMYGGGGAAADTTTASGGAGGGRSAILLNGREIVTAGGGGGQGSRNDTNYAGGGAANANGSQSAQGYSNGGTGGSSTISGIGALNALTGGYAQNGYYLTGGAALNYGGGGGGGYFGGGGGAATLSNAAQTGNGGGGGGSYYNPNLVLSLVTNNGTRGTPGGTTNEYYIAGIGQGGTRSNAGGNGLVVFSYTTITTKPQVSSEGNFTSLYVENLATNQIEIRQPQTPLYVAVGSDTNSIQYSTDGKNWSNVTNNFSGNFNLYGLSIAYNGNYWIATGYDNGNGSIKYSQDGINWINAGIGVTFSYGGLCIAWNGKMWLAGGGFYLPTILYSYDGFTWKPANNTYLTYLVVSVAWNGEMWVALGASQLPDPYTLAYSYDGINWINSPTIAFVGSQAGYFGNVAWNGKIWVATCYDNTGKTIVYSSDGINWSNIVTGGFNIHGNSVAWNGQYWMAVGFDTTNTVQVSPDGSNWSTTLPNGQSVLPNAPTFIGQSVIWDGTKWFITSYDSGTASIKYSGQDSAGNFTWINATSGGFSGGRGGQGIAYNNPQLPYLQNSNIALYQRTNTQPLYDTPPNNFIKTTETSLNINNALYVNVSTIASTNLTYFNSKVGIFQPNPTYDLELAHDSAFKPITNVWTTTSDRRVKENIQYANLELCASTLTTLSLQNYSYTSSFANLTGVSEEQRYGLIAQEVQEVNIPHTVTTKPAYGFDDFHCLNTDQIHYIHMATTQYLIEKMSTQQSTINGLLALI
jgi:hypothetical protein